MDDWTTTVARIPEVCSSLIQSRFERKASFARMPLYHICENRFGGQGGLDPWDSQVSKLGLAEALSVILGILPAADGQYLPISETVRLRLYMRQVAGPYFLGWNSIEEGRDVHAERALAEFCNVHLGSLLDLILDPPKAIDPPYATWASCNVYLIALADLLLYSPYCRKFFTSDAGCAQRGKDVGTYLARHLLLDLRTMLRANWVSAVDQSNIERACQSLLTIIVLHLDDDGFVIPLPKGVAKGLYDVLSDCLWDQQQTKLHRLDTIWAEFLFNIIYGGSEGLLWMLKMAASGGRCNRRGCMKRVSDPDEVPFYRCGRCHTVLYCTRKHQREDWRDTERPHELLCFETRF